MPSDRSTFLVVVHTSNSLCKKNLYLLGIFFFHQKDIKLRHPLLNSGGQYRSIPKQETGYGIIVTYQFAFTPGADTTQSNELHSTQRQSHADKDHTERQSVCKEKVRE